MFPVQNSQGSLAPWKFLPRNFTRRTLTPHLHSRATLAFHFSPIPGSLPGNSLEVIPFFYSFPTFPFTHVNGGENRKYLRRRVKSLYDRELGGTWIRNIPTAPRGPKTSPNPSRRKRNAEEIGKVGGFYKCQTSAVRLLPRHQNGHSKRNIYFSTVS